MADASSWVYAVTVDGDRVNGRDGTFSLIIDFKDWTMANVDYAVMKYVREASLWAGLGGCYSLRWRVVSHSRGQLE